MPRDTANTQELFFGNDSICANAKMSFSFSIVISQLHWKCDAETRLGHKACWDAVQWGMLHTFIWSAPTWGTSIWSDGIYIIISPVAAWQDPSYKAFQRENTACAACAVQELFKLTKMLDPHSTSPRNHYCASFNSHLVKLLLHEVQGSLLCLSFHSQGGPFNLFPELNAKEGVSHLLKCVVQSGLTAFCFPKRIWEKDGALEYKQIGKVSIGEQENNHWAVLAGKHFRRGNTWWVLLSETSHMNMSGF